jgi:hypothetical protein
MHIGEAEVQLHPFLTSALYEGGVQLRDPAASPSGKNPGTHRLEGWMGPRAGLDVVWEEKNLLRLLGFGPSNP